MKFEIKHRWSGDVLFSVEAASICIAVTLAIRSDANLCDANLRGANLCGADLCDANLRGADLCDANLRDANLRGADLRDANLRDANLRGANLCGANLCGANLCDANLCGANLCDANLCGASLRNANGVNKFFCTSLLMLLDQPGKIRAYKLVNENFEGPHNGGIKYEQGQPASEPAANCDENQHCAAGINLATLDWCMKEWRNGYHILVAEFEAADIAAIPTATDGKFRVKQCVIVGEKDLKEIGLVK